MPNTVELPNLLRTKFYRPRVTGELIRRPRMFEILDRHPDRSLTLVCAPAGFGKTMLVSDWLEKSQMPSAWLSLDQGDGNLAGFLTYFVAAVRMMFSAACANTLALLRTPLVPPLNILATTLANDLEKLDGRSAPPPGQRFVLVLDDYHLVQGEQVHALLSELFRHPPRTMHLVIVTRQDPPLPLHALRVRGELSEVRTPELRFTRDEVAAFMNQALGRPLDAEAVTILSERTEGWVTGLRLAALTLSAGGDVEGPELAVDNRFALDYLLNEVLARIPAATEGFLLKTSILHRLCGPLCDAVAGLPGPAWDGHAYLEWLAAQNLFTFSLDTQGTWYRYHHLFRTLLRNRLERNHSPEEISELHAQASSWYTRMGFINEAIEHALAAGDENAAVRLVEANRHQAMNQERWQELEHWLKLMPRSLIDARPELLMMEAWIVQKQWRLPELAPYVARIEALMARLELPEANRVRLVGEIHTLRAVAAYYAQDGEQTCFDAELALKNTPFECSLVRGMAWFYYAAARQMTGDVQGALDALREGLKEDRVHGNAFLARLYVGFGLIHWMDADLQNLLLIAAQMLQLSQQRDLAEAGAWAHYFKGCAFYQLNDLVEAEREFGEVVRQRYRAHAYAYSQSTFGLASILSSQGAIDRARDVVDSLAVYALETNNNRITNDVDAFRAWLALRAGSVAEALRWAESHRFESLFAPMTTFQVALIAQSRVLILAGTAEGLAHAEQILARLHEVVATTHNSRYMIEVLALQALLLDARGDRRALTTLEQAIHLAEPGGLIRAFVDLGPRMGALVRQLVNRGVAPSYVSRLLAAFSVPSEDWHVGLQAARTPHTGGQSSLIEPLSDRELEVLTLLSERLINKEIARELGISVMTVKRHTINIYQKLSVGNRRSAVARGYALGLLPLARPLRRRP